MEILAAAVGAVVGCVCSQAAERCKHHRDIYKNMESLKENLDILNCQKSDIENRLETEVVLEQNEETNELKSWLKRVEDTTSAIKEIENKVRNVKWLCQSRLGRRVEEKIKDVDNLHKEGDKFTNGNLVRTVKQLGNERPMPLGLLYGGDTPAEKTKREILRCLADEKAKIGVYGMGGSGKTTVLGDLHNDLLKAGDKFDKVFWITASKASDVRGLQDKIGREINVGFDEKDDEERRAIVLFNELKNKRFLLIIDDLWEHYPLEKIGVPNPTPENGCKLVLTTRSRDVCSNMGCDEIIKMELLSVQQARELFIEKVGIIVASVPRLADMARDFAKECAGLPLAVVTVAGSMRDKTDVKEWEVALTELKDATHSASDKITTILMFSYDRLKDVRFKECLLHCALYPEDHLINRSSLIYQLIAQGSIDDRRTVKARKDKCHVMLNELVRDCLLIDHSEYYVKLHDSVRDMAIQIMRKTPSRYLIDAKGEEKWDEGLEKVSFTGNNKTILVAEPPKCPSLSTLLFINAKELEIISEDFFTGMKGLCVLDLSGTSIRILPGSVTRLENLVVLSLRGCKNLMCLPDLSELRNLIMLDLGYSGITEYLQGLEKLVKLTHLDLGGVKVEYYPKGLLSELSNLSYLSIDLPSETRIENDGPMMIPNNVETLTVWGGVGKSLCCSASVENIKNLQTLWIRECKEMEYMLYNSPALFPLLQNINELRLYELYNLRALVMGAESDGTALPLGAFSSLKKLVIGWCPKLKRVFVVGKEASLSLPSLEVIHIFDCRELEEIISYEKEDAMIINLPRLESIELRDLPKLKTVFVVGKEASLSLPSLEVISIGYCMELEEIISYENEDAMIINLLRLESIYLWNLPKLKNAQFHVPDSLSVAKIIKCPELKEVTPSLQPFVDMAEDGSDAEEEESETEDEIEDE